MDETAETTETTETAETADYITVDEAAAILRLTHRQVNRYGSDGRIGTRKVGRRVLYLRTDVEALAEELDVENRPAPKQAKAELIPMGDMLEYLRERDQRIEELQRQVLAAAVELTRAQSQLEQQKQLAEDRDVLLKRIAELETQQAQKRPRWGWVKRLFQED